MTPRPQAPHSWPARARDGLRRRGVGLALLLAASLVGGAAVAGETPADEGFSAGLEVRKLSNVAETGLPAYPGAVLWKDGEDDGGGASLGLWGGAFGIRLQAVKLRSADGVDAVAAWYRQAMSGMGRVVDCSAGAPAVAADPPQKLLACGKDRATPGKVLFKVGKPDLVHMVSIEPVVGGSRIQLVRLQVRGD